MSGECIVFHQGFGHLCGERVGQTAAAVNFRQLFQLRIRIICQLKTLFV